MSFCSRLKEARRNKGLTQKQLALKVGLAKSTIAGYENGSREPNILTTTKMMNILSVDANYLWQDEMGISFPETLNFSEKNYLEKYHKLDKYGKDIVRIILDKEYDRCINVSKHDTIIKTELPLYVLPTSAGTGQFLDAGDYEIKTFSNVPIGSNFAVRISGDSMEPKYSDKDIVFVKQEQNQQELDGQVGIFIFNGEWFIKELDCAGHSLISFNGKYSPIIISQYDDVRIVGRVLGKANEEV